MKKIITTIVLSLLLLTACGEKHIFVSSIITDKWDRQWVQAVPTGKVVMTIYHHDYYFNFNEWKPYTKKVQQSVYNKFEIGDIYTFAIDKHEKEYFFNESIVEVE